MSRKSTIKNAPAREVSLDHYVKPGDSIGGLVREVYRSFTRSLQVRILREGATIGMWFVLRALWEEDGMTQRELGQRASINGPSIVTQLNALERAGFVERVPNKKDRRKINVFLTKRGHQLKQKLWPMAAEVNALALRHITGETADTLANTLTQILRNLELDRRGFPGRDTHAGLPIANSTPAKEPSRGR